MKKLLLHVCCGPCLLGASFHLKDLFEITCYYYNPNIYPADEYMRRLEGAKKASSALSLEFIEAHYVPGEFEEISRGLETEPENGARCLECYKLRLTRTAQYARENGFAYISTTLTTGPRKRASDINQIGESAADLSGVTIVEGDWKKKDGFIQAMKLASEMDIYRQNYCGCVYSVR